MTTQIIKNAKMMLGGYDLSGQLNSLSLQLGSEMQDDTVFGDNTRTSRSGIITVSAEINGFVEDDSSDPKVGDRMYAEIGLENSIFSAYPENHAETDVGVAMKVMQGSFVPGGAVGDLHAFSADFQARSRLYNGTVVHNASKTSTGNGTALQLGAVGANDELYAWMHVTSAVGTTLDVDIESDNSGGFSSATTRGSFTQVATTVTSQLTAKLNSGAITDDWWRVAYTIAGGGPYVFLVGISIIPALPT